MTRTQRPHRRWTGWWRADTGSAAVETTLVAPLLIMLLVFVGVVVHRGVGARIRIDDVAHQAARAASLERSIITADTAARSTAARALSTAGMACRSWTVSTTGGIRPGGSVSVTLTCDIDLGDALILSLPGSRRLSSQATEPIDSWRSVETPGSGE